MFFRSSATGLVAVALISTAPAQVPEQPQLRIDLQVEREITVVPPSGQVEIRREPVQEATVGDVLVYTLIGSSRRLNLLPPQYLAKRRDPRARLAVVAGG